MTAAASVRVPIRVPGHHHGSAVRWMFIYCCALHVAWGSLMLTHGAEVSLLTSINKLDELIPGPLWVTAAALFAASALAFVGIRYNGSQRGMLCLMPQQVLMLLWAMISAQTIAGGAVFHDEVLLRALGRDHVRGLLLAVESQTVLAATLHTLTMFDVYGGEVVRKWISRLGPSSSR